jgi:hypothetical protein
MTAKQLKAKLIEQIELGNPDAAKVLLMQYETQLCREQREICADESDKNAVIDETVKPKQIFVDKEDVLNAKMPEI